MINGALTIGTLDGANVEMREEVGADNFFLCGFSEAEVERIKRDGYRPSEYVDSHAELAAVLELIAAGHSRAGTLRCFARWSTTCATTTRSSSSRTAPRGPGCRS